MNIYCPYHGPIYNVPSGFPYSKMEHTKGRLDALDAIYDVVDSEGRTKWRVT